MKITVDLTLSLFWAYCWPPPPHPKKHTSFLKVSIDITWNVNFSSLKSVPIKEINDPLDSDNLLPLAFQEVKDRYYDYYYSQMAFEHSGSEVSWERACPRPRPGSGHAGKSARCLDSWPSLQSTSPPFRANTHLGLLGLAMGSGQQALPLFLLRPCQVQPFLWVILMLVTSCQTVLSHIRVKSN